MKNEIKKHPIYGECLYLTNETVEVYVPLSFGLRIGHFSFIGEKNVFFEQPLDMEMFTTPDGWKIRGGHRMWLAPESEKCYAPDNEPISYTLTDDGVILTQKEDMRLRVIKEFRLSFDGARVRVTHKITNTKDEEQTYSLWAISVMRSDGVETIKLPLRDGGMDHMHRISMWDYTSLGDERAKYSRDKIEITHLPLDTKYKIGVGHPISPVRYENGSTVFLKHFDVLRSATYPDADVSYETFFSKYMVEMESLSPLYTLKPHESREHTEIWELLRKE